MLKFNFRIEHFIIAVLAILLLLEGCEKDPEPEIVTVEKIVTVKDSASKPGINNREPEKVKVIEEDNQVKQIENEKELTQEEKAKLKPAFRYRDTTYFQNARIFTDILSEGRILKFDISSAIDHREITTTKNTTNQPGGLFFSPAVNYSPVFGIEQAEINLNYIKGNWGAGLGAYLNFRTGPGFKISIHKKLF